jgi:hypothetical protein
MTRASAATVALVLAREAVDVKAATLRQWRARGHLSQGRGYDLIEILAYIDKRGEKAA